MNLRTSAEHYADIRHHTSPEAKGDKEYEAWMLTSALALTGINFSETQFLILLNKEIGAGHWFSNFFPLIS